MNSVEKTIGLLGLGLMGEPMAQNWIKKGFKLNILPHRNKAPAERLSKLGAHVCSSQRELIEKSDVIVLMLPSSKEVEEVCLTSSESVLNLAKPHQITIDMTTSDPASTRRVGHELKKNSLRFMDAPVTGGVKGAADGTLTLFIGGEIKDYSEVKEVLAAVSKTQTHFGALGLGHVAKAINNYICIGNLAVLCEALPLGRAMGLDAKLLIETLLSGTAASEMMKVYVPQIMSGDFNPRFKLEHAYKDLVIALRMAEFAQAELPILEAMLLHFANAEKAGFTGQNLSAIIKPIEKELGVEFRS